MTRKENLLCKVSTFSALNCVAQNDVFTHERNLAEAKSRLKTIRKLGREALFDLYVSSSHRSFVKFLRTNDL
ncbi:MAG: hypothetical protein DRQ62_10795 [Gammaproteobacteria bacterium]|nr:MAG: hypothetical protein DRQ62_10795 [Gammaproteobacteria bacterium]